MFIGKYDLEGKTYFNIYDNHYDWHKDTFSPDCKNIEVLALQICGSDYREKQSDLIEIAKDWQSRFSYYEWSYGELAAIQNWFYENAKRYGLLNEFRENGIC